VAIFTIVLLVTFNSTVAFGAQSEDEIENGSISKYVISEPYQYSIIQGTDEWFDLTMREDRISAYYVPDKIVSNMTTEALMLTVMSNPYFINLYAFDSIDVGLEVVSSYVSGLKELCLRPDFY